MSLIIENSIKLENVSLVGKSTIEFKNIDKIAAAKLTFTLDNKVDGFVNYSQGERSKAKNAKTRKFENKNFVIVADDADFVFELANLLALPAKPGALEKGRVLFIKASALGPSGNASASASAFKAKNEDGATNEANVLAFYFDLDENAKTDKGVLFAVLGVLAVLFFLFLVFFLFKRKKLYLLRFP